MDPSMLNRLTRAASTTRRIALRTMLSGTAVGAASTLGPTRGGDAKHHHKHKKHKCKQKKCKGGVLGEPCETSKECCSNETNLLCSVPNGGPQTVCCAGFNGACESDEDCCSGFVCSPNGICSVGTPG